MLTRELAIADYDGARVLPDRLTRGRDAAYLGYAERMLTVYRTGVGRTRRELHRDVHAVFADEADCPMRRIEAFCKLLDDTSEFDRDRKGEARELRRQVFRLAGPLHPLVDSVDRLFEHQEAEAKRQIAEQMGRSWEDVDGALFADVIEFHRLRQFDGYADAAALLARYNVAQTQAALFDASEMTVWATADFKTVLRYAKLARLMHTIRPTNDGYVIRFDGPASVLRETRRYGAAMARFLPALLACRGWRMHAVLRPKGRAWLSRLDLSPADGLTSQLPPPDEFDSDLEAAFAEKWGTEPRERWTLLREAEVLHVGQHVFVPDFVFQHADGRRVMLELVGFLTPEYLQAKLDTLARFANHPVLLAVADSLGEESTEWPSGTIRFKSALRIGDVLERLSEVRGPECGRP
ncbi:MAG TPA: DUF790 family protein [Pirellulales bacterium]|nr:DUF790 family protein [Pirellulales bacterium]